MIAAANVPEAPNIVAEVVLSAVPRACPCMVAGVADADPQTLVPLSRSSAHRHPLARLLRQAACRSGATAANR
jgi:hypothetical protein